MTTTKLPTRVDEVVEAVHEASRTGTPLRFRGAGTWMMGGGPFADAPELVLRGLDQVIEYVPGDLVITVGAGMPLATLREITAAHGQQFALDPYGDAASTIGACIATATAAPLAPNDFEMRDLVLGLEAVLGTGECTQAGGRVVKNVAGFDLVRLHTGAWGTLGAITAVSLRLHARPLIDQALWAACPMPVTDPAFAGFVDQLVANRAPVPMLVVITPGQRPHLVVRVAGNAARASALGALIATFGVGPVTERSIDETLALLRTTPIQGGILRLRAPRGDAAQLIQTVHRAWPEATLLFNPSRGSVRVLQGARATESAAACWARIRQSAASTTIRCAIDQGRTAAAMRSPLEQRVKHALDPHDLCNRLLAGPDADRPDNS